MKSRISWRSLGAKLAIFWATMEQFYKNQGLLIFESDIIIRTISTKEDRERKHNRLLIKEH